MKKIKASKNVKLVYNETEESWTVTFMEKITEKTKISACVEIESERCWLDSSWVDLSTGLLNVTYFPEQPLGL